MKENAAYREGCIVRMLAHEDSVWSCAWGRSERDGADYVVSGSIDDLVKIWKWCVPSIAPSSSATLLFRPLFLREMRSALAVRATKELRRRFEIREREGRFATENRSQENLPRSAATTRSPNSYAHR